MRNWAALVGALGGVFTVFGLLTVLLWAAQSSLPLWWVGANLGIGFGCLAIAALASIETLRERLRSGATRRAGKYGTSAVISAVASIAILAILAVLATRYPVRFDWSEQGVHTLSPQSLELLEALDRDVRVTALFNPLDAPAYRDLLERYAIATERVDLEFIDPNERPDVVETMELVGEDLSRGWVRIEMGDEKVDVRVFDEVALTQALVRLVRSSNKAAYFLEGHNERRIRGAESLEPGGYQRAAASLLNETYRVLSLLLAAVAEVPEDASVVIIAGPTRLFLPEERAALHRYVERGGSLLVLIDPRARTDLYDDLREWGIRMGDDVVVDPELALVGRATSPFAGQYADHAITRELREPTLFHMARSVDLVSRDVRDLETLVYSGKEAWAERDLEGWAATGRAEYGADDAMGPVPLAVVGVPEVEVGTPGRIVVFGDSDFATNEYIEVYRNRDLFVNAVNWLVGDEDAITVRPNRSRASRFQLSTEQFGRIQFASLFALPQAIALIGVLAWWWRRSRRRS